MRNLRFFAVGSETDPIQTVAALALVGLLAACDTRSPPRDAETEEALISTQPLLPEAKEDASGNQAVLGTLDDNLPFRPRGQQVASIAWRTWIYTDTGPKRTRLGYLRAGAIVDARGPLLKNDGCAGGWLRINPRGFVCLGKGATVDLEHPVVQEMSIRPRRGDGFPYRYAKSRSRSPERYFRLPTREQMVEIEGREALDRAAQFRIQAKRSGLEERWGLGPELPSFLDADTVLQKPYGVDTYLRRRVHSGRTSPDSGFALVDTFYWEERAFGLTSELDLVALDRLELLPESDLQGLVLDEENTLPVAFVVRGAITMWEKNEAGQFVLAKDQTQRRGFYLTGRTGRGGMLETKSGVWIDKSSVRILEPRSGFPSVATGTRKWIDISNRTQSLVAYEGTRPVYATLISSGRGGLGEAGDSNPDGNKTVRGTFMIHEKTISSTMDGDDDRSDSFDLQDVPFVQYFHRGFALHGAYWHDEFGKKRSHGCINLAARDSAWLFEWSDPPVPPGWHAVLNKKRGTVVIVGY